MTRDLAYITDSSMRKTTFKKRAKGLKKKIDELSILCRIEACSIIYMADKPEPEIWPSEEGVQSVLSRFMATPELERRQKMFNKEALTRMTIIKAQEKLKKLKNENRKIEMNLHMSQYFFNTRNTFDNANVIHPNDISHLTNQNLEQVKKKINVWKTHKVTPVPKNGGETMTQGEQELVNHVQGSETNVAAMKNLNWSMDIHNGSGREEIDVSLLEDVCLKWLA